MHRVWTVVAVVGGLLFLIGCVVVLFVLFQAKGLQYAASAAGVLGLLLALRTLAVALMRRLRPVPAPTAEQVDQARDTLAGQVAEQWRREALARSLGHPQPMPVHWRLTEHAVMDRPQRVMAEGPFFAGSSDEISQLTEQFRRLRRRRLVILGGPGSGKTTLAVQLLLELLATREEAEPIPVLLSLAGWYPTTHPELHSWLAERLADDYPSLPAFGPDVARALVEQGHIMPILDGLDELPPAHQPQVIAALNASLTETDQVVLTSRTEEYETAIGQAHMVLSGAAVIEPEPLTPSHAADYLKECLLLDPDPSPSWLEVLDQIRGGTAKHLAAVAATPLGLWLVRTVYITPRADPTPLLTSEVARDAATLQVHLFDRLIPAVLTARPRSRNPHELFRPRRTWDPIKVRGWLTYLAQHLDRTKTRDLLWWHLARHTFTHRTFGLVVGLGTGLGIGLVCGLVFGLTTWLVEGSVYGLGLGLGQGLGAGLVLGLLCGLGNAAGLRTGLIAGLVLGLVYGLVLGLAAGLLTGLAAGLVSALMVGSGLGPELVNSLGVGLLIGWGNATIFGLASLVAGLRIGLGGQGWLTGEPAYANLQLKNRSETLGRDLLVGLLLGLGAALMFRLAFGLVTKPFRNTVTTFVAEFGGVAESNLWPVLVVGLLVGLVAGLLRWVGTPSTIGWASTPRSTYIATRALTAMQLCIGVLAVWLFVGLIAWLGPGPDLSTLAEPITGAAFAVMVAVVVFVQGLGPGMVLGLGLMSSGAWLSYKFTSFWLAATRKLPLRLMGFLDDAYRLGLLRMTGPAYQFRHAEFHDHLSQSRNSGTEPLTEHPTTTGQIRNQENRWSRWWPGAGSNRQPSDFQA